MYNFKFKVDFDFSCFDMLSDTLRNIAKQIDNREGGVQSLHGQSFPETGGLYRLSGSWECFDKDLNSAKEERNELLAKIGELIRDFQERAPG